jgi:hypothetical protein
MARVEDKKIVLNEEELALLKNGEEFDLIPNREGIFLLIDKKKAVEEEGAQVCVSVPLIEAHQEVIDLIKKGKLNELVEGKFEEKLDEKQKTALLELKSTGKVFLFKLNETYKKGVYKIKEDEESENKEEKGDAKKELEEIKKKKKKKKDSEDFNAKPKQFPDYTLEDDGFVATKNNERARILSMEHKEQIEGKELQGIKSFEGIYYLVDNKLLEKYKLKIIQVLEQKNNLQLEEIAKEINASAELGKIVCEFLKEEGEILEKKKGEISFIQ